MSSVRSPYRELGLNPRARPQFKADKNLRGPGLWAGANDKGLVKLGHRWVRLGKSNVVCDYCKRPSFTVYGKRCAGRKLPNP